jgi:hypothetical protein
MTQLEYQAVREIVSLPNWAFAFANHGLVADSRKAGETRGCESKSLGQCLMAEEEESGGRSRGGGNNGGGVFITKLDRRGPVPSTLAVNDGESRQRMFFALRLPGWSRLNAKISNAGRCMWGYNQ